MRELPKPEYRIKVTADFTQAALIEVMEIKKDKVLLRVQMCSGDVSERWIAITDKWRISASVVFEQ
jgi:hypothetical protein